MSNSITRGIVWAVAAAAIAAPAGAQQTVRLPGKDQALKDRPTPVFTVGTVDGRDWAMFSGIRSVAFDRSDNLYLLDGQNSRVVVFDAKGKFVRQFGRKGGGPGELQAPLAMDIASDGSVVVSDLGNRAFIVFRPDGEYVRNIPFDEELGFPMNMAADARGGIIVRATARVRPDQPAVDNFSPIYRQPLAGSAAGARTLYRVPTAAPRVMQSAGTGPARRVSMSMDPVFGPRPTFGALPAGVALHHESEYAVRVLDAAGRHLRTLTRDFKPRKVTKKDQEEWLEQRRNDAANGTGPTVVMMRATPAGRSASVGTGGQAPSGMAMSLDNVEFAEFMSIVTSIRTDPQSRIWVQRRSADGKAAGPIDLVMPDGRYIGTLPPQELPGAVSASGLAAWVVTDAELGVERVVVRRLPASWR